MSLITELWIFTAFRFFYGCYWRLQCQSELSCSGTWLLGWMIGRVLCCGIRPLHVEAAHEHACTCHVPSWQSECVDPLFQVGSNSWLMYVIQTGFASLLLTNLCTPARFTRHSILDSPTEEGNQFWQRIFTALVLTIRYWLLPSRQCLCVWKYGEHFQNM
jgi:hypothetical protein